MMKGKKRRTSKLPSSKLWKLCPLTMIRIKISKNSALSFSCSSCLLIVLCIRCMSTHLQAYLYQYFCINVFFLKVFLQVLPGRPFNTFYPEALVRSPTVGPRLIRQSGQSAPSLYRPEASSPSHRGLGPLSGTPSKTTETHRGAGWLN